MIKFKLYYDKDEETKWLNEMSAKGFAMTGFFAGFYRFKECEPDKYIYQVDFGGKMFSVSEDYREFMRDTGVELVQLWGPWIFLRKLASEGEFELYTDIDSSIEYYTKIRNMFKVVTIIEIICLFMELFVAINGETWAYAAMFLIGAMIIALINAVFKTNRIIAELQERKGVKTSVRCNGSMSALLPCGMLLNSCALIMEDYVYSPVKIGIQIVAIVLLVVGIYRTMRNNSDKNF